MVSGTGGTLVLSGERVWTVTAQGKADLPNVRAAQLKEAMDIFAPAKFIDSEDPRKVTGIEKAGGQRCFVVESTGAKSTRRLYIDVQTGLLRKMQLEQRTPLGIAASELALEDYRDVNGVKMPFTLVALSASDRTVYQFSEIAINVAVESGKFEPPAAK